jgi:hypothetical protein
MQTLFKCMFLSGERLGQIGGDRCFESRVAREWKKPWGAGSGGGGFPGYRQGEAGVPAPEGVLQAAFRDRQPDLGAGLQFRARRRW